MAVREIKTSDQFYDYIDIKSKYSYAVAYFTASWCGPCQHIAPKIPEIAENVPDVKIMKIDIDEHRKLSSKYNVLSVPAFLLFKRGSKTPIDQVNGANLKKLMEMISNRR
jgi:thioredoxin 1